MRLVQVPYGPHAMISKPCPDLGPEYFKSYSMAMPIRTHWRRATCEEYGCEDFIHGFVLTVDISTDLGQRQAAYVKADKSRRCSVQREGPSIVKFVYGPGNECFEPKRSEHIIQIGRPPFYLVSQGDWRGNPRKIPTLRRRVEDWVDDFATHQDKIAEAVRRG